jgi:RNA recognition motif-containing protein
MKGYGHVEFATSEAAQKVNNLLTNLLLNAA